MALVKETLKQSIKAAFVQARTAEENADQVFDTLADQIATAVDAFVKSGIVNSTGTCSTGPVTTVGTIS